MIPEARARFNREFTPAKYEGFLRRLDQRCGTHIPFRCCETPCFFSPQLIDKLVRAGEDLILQLTGDSEYLAATDATIPPAYNAAGVTPRPLFICADFGLTPSLEPKLVEIQGFPSLYAFQPALAETYREIFGVEGRSLLAPDYWTLLRRAIVGGHDPATVALVEVDPYHQKTLADFLLTREQLGIRVVNIGHIEKRGCNLWADGRPITRIYNRAIVDELERRQIPLRFDLRDDLDVEWAGHPNWYFRISKFSLPYLKHACVPATRFLHQIAELPADLEGYVLKPLYSFAGLGVVVGPTREQVEAIPDPQNWILQERVEFAPLIDTPFGPTKAEIRVMYVWLDEKPVAVTTIVRMGRGKMMGVDHNKNLEWVGASAGLVIG